ncbi:hypothetical protein F5X96DRAFT_631323 [Biscogniauxia mediterranea]|nr:hypothetical protein F5X96DRAFT_631323 [Biscogniauxia mediterranea]
MARVVCLMMWSGPAYSSQAIGATTALPISRSIFDISHGRPGSQCARLPIGRPINNNILVSCRDQYVCSRSVMVRSIRPLEMKVSSIGNSNNTAHMQVGGGQHRSGPVHESDMQYIAFITNLGWSGLA